MNEAILAIRIFWFFLPQLIESMDHSMLDFFLCGMGNGPSVPEALGAPGSPGSQSGPRGPENLKYTY